MSFLNLVLLATLVIASTQTFSIGKTYESNLPNEYAFTIPSSTEREVVQEETKDAELEIADLSEQKGSQAVEVSLLDLSETKQEDSSSIKEVKDGEAVTSNKKEEGHKQHGHGHHEGWMKEQERRGDRHGHGKINKFDHHGHKYDKHEHDHFDLTMESDESSEEHCD